MTDLDLISIGAKNSSPGQFSREFTEEQWIAAARAIESAATAPLLERIAELEVKLAQRGKDDELTAIVPGSWGPLKLMMGASSWQGRVELSDVLANIDEFSAAPAAPEQQEPMTCAECGGVLGHTRMCSKFPGYGGSVDQAPKAQQAEAQEPCQGRTSRGNSCCPK